MGTRSVEIGRFEQVLEILCREFPLLRMDVQREHPHVHAIADIPVQPGLDFSVGINLQNLDELHLNAGKNLWVEWFPCRKEEVFDDYVRAVTGVISGHYRIVERYLFGRADSALLERPNGRGGWERVATWGTLGRLVPGPRVQRVLQNRSAAVLRDGRIS